MSEIMQELRKIKPECQNCINAIQFRAELVVYRAATNASDELIKSVYLRGLQSCTGLISTISNGPEWVEERMEKDEKQETISAWNRQSSAERAAEEELRLIKIPELTRVNGVTRTRTMCPVFP